MGIRKPGSAYSVLWVWVLRVRILWGHGSAGMRFRMPGSAYGVSHDQIPQGQFANRDRVPQAGLHIQCSTGPDSAGPVCKRRQDSTGRAPHTMFHGMVCGSKPVERTRPMWDLDSWNLDMRNLGWWKCDSVEPGLCGTRTNEIKLLVQFIKFEI